MASMAELFSFCISCTYYFKNKKNMYHICGCVFTWNCYICYLSIFRYRSVVNNIPSDWTTLRVESQGVTRYSVYGLQPDTVYEFRVLARNDLGSGQYSNTVQAKTLGIALSFNYTYFTLLTLYISTGHSNYLYNWVLMHL